MIKDKQLFSNRIDTIIRAILYLMISVLPFSKAGIEICFVAALSLWIIKRLILRDARPPVTILNKPLLIYIIIGILSVIASSYFKMSLRAFFTKFMEGILLYFIIVEVFKKKRHLFIVTILLFLSATVTCVDGLIQKYLTGFDLFRHVSMVRGGITAAFDHKNDLGAYLLFPVSITWSLLIYKLFLSIKSPGLRDKRYNAAILVSFFCLFSVALGLTSSVGAWLSIIAAIFLSSILARKQIFTAMIVSMFLAFVFLALSYEARLIESRHEVVNISSALSGRMLVWKEVIALIKDKPIFGTGLSTFMRTFQKYHSGVPTYAHNCYLQIAAEMGISGLICFLWIIGKLFWSSFRLVLSFDHNKRQGYYLQLLFIGLLSGLFAFLIHSFVDTNLYSLQLNALFWYMMGLTVCAYNLLCKK